MHARMDVLIVRLQTQQVVPPTNEKCINTSSAVVSTSGIHPTTTGDALFHRLIDQIWIY
jgi:hypothetical protein